MIEDAELLRRHRAGGAKAQGAFAELVRRHVDLVYSAALRRVGGDAHAAADVTQQVFVALARRGPREGARLVAWLYGTTRNVAVDFVRAEKGRRVRELEAAMRNEVNAEGNSSADWERLRPLLDEVMDELGESEREAVLLRFFARRPFAEIGRALGWSEDAARMRVERALEKLRVQLARRGVTSTAAGLALALTQQAVAAAPAGLAAAASGAATAAAAGAGGIGGTAAGWIQFMSSSKIAAGGAALVLAVAAGTAVHDVRVARTAEAALGRARSEGEAAAVRGREMERRAAEAERAVEELRKRLQATQAAKTAGLPRAAQPTIDAARHPELRQVLIDQARAAAATQYAGLFRELRLSPEQIERFKDLVAQGKSGRKAGPEGVMVAYSTGGDTVVARRELEELLGPEGFGRFCDYEGGLSAVQRTAQLASALADLGVPLTVEQGDAMRRLLMEHRVPREGAAGGVAWKRFDWEPIVSGARRMLSHDQIAVLESYRARDEFDEAANAARSTRAKVAGERVKGGR